MKAYIGKELHTTIPVIWKSISWNGTLVLGQDQDDVGGGYSILQAFRGKVYDFNIWNISLSTSDVKQIETNNSSKLINWASSEWISHGSSSYVNETFPNSEIIMLIVPRKLHFHKIQKWCHNVNMSVVSPTNQVELEVYYEFKRTIPLTCTSLYVSGYPLWLGLRIDSTRNALIDPVRNISDSSVLSEYYNINETKPDSPLALINPHHFWFWTTSQDLSLCSVCTQYTTSLNSVIYLRGLCNSKFNNYLPFYPRIGINNSMILVSNFGMKILFEGSISKIIRADNNKVLAKTKSCSPFGTVEWKVYVKNGSCHHLKSSVDEIILVTPVTRKLVLSICSHDEFSCSDGSCQPMEKRCNHNIECPDGSDELECELIHQSMKNIMPPPDEPLPMFVRLGVIVS